MLKDRIISTLKYFDLQDLPLTLLEIHKFLLANKEEIKQRLDGEWNLKSSDDFPGPRPVTVGDVLTCLEVECPTEVGCSSGFYFLAGRQAIVNERLRNYLNGIKREKLIKKFIGFCRFLPFVRGVALGGSQALGQERKTSDMDLFIITDPKYFWLARTFITSYFQLLGRRRHGKKIADRFCLNHYVAGVKVLSQSLDLYQATDIVKFRPLMGVVGEFQQANENWVKVFFPNFYFNKGGAQASSITQAISEKIFNNRFGQAVEKKLGQWQMARIKRGEFIVAEPGEISFHSKQKKQQLFAALFN